MSNPFKVGDVATAIAKRVISNHTITAHADYKVLEVDSKYIKIINDDGAVVSVYHDRFELLASQQAPLYQGAMGAANRQAQRAHTTTAVDEEVSYDTRKANASVLSQGRFKVGQVLVYCDGTPTATSLTVKRCTATGVWFDETYSTPFNPDEFTLEYYDE